MRAVTVLHFLCFWMLELPLAWALAGPIGLGTDGVFWSVCVAESLLAVLGIWLFRRGKWKEVRMTEDSAS